MVTVKLTDRNDESVERMAIMLEKDSGILQNSPIRIFFSEQLNTPVLSAKDLAFAISSTKAEFEQSIKHRDKVFRSGTFIPVSEFLFNASLSSKHPLTHAVVSRWLVEEALPEFFRQAHGMRITTPLLNPMQI